MKLSKKTIILLSIGTLVVGGSGYLLAKKAKSNNAAYVESVANLNQAMWMTETSDGYISDSAAQQIYLTSEEKVAEVYVEAGQSVKKGDPIISYDVTSLESEKELVYLTKEAKNQQLNLEKTRLVNTQNLPTLTKEEKQALSSQVATLEDEIDALAFQLQTLQNELDALEDIEDIEDETLPSEQPSREEEIMAEMATINEQMATKQNEIDALIQKDAQTYLPEDKESLIQEKKLAIKRLETSMKSDDATIQSINDRIEDNVVKAMMDGVVSEIRDASMNDGLPYITITSDDGYVLVGYVDEYAFANMKIGDEMKVTSWQTMVSSNAHVVSISPYPSKEQVGYHYGNNNFSYFEYKAVVESKEGFTIGEYVSIEQGDNSDKIIIEKLYVVGDETGTYVYKDDNGRLVKQYVEVQPTSYGDSLIITSGLTQEDAIAFPHGKSAFEGNKTTYDQGFTLLF